MDALSLHAWVLLCAVEAGELDLDRAEDEIATTVQQAQRLASTSTMLAGTHALHQLVHGRLAESVEHAREAIIWDRDRSTRADDLVTLAEALAGLGESGEAGSAMAEAQQLWPDNPRLTGVRANLEDMNVSDLVTSTVRGASRQGQPVSSSRNASRSSADCGRAK